MEGHALQPRLGHKKMVKQLTGKRDDGLLHRAARAGDLCAVTEILAANNEHELNELLSKRNYSGETPLFVAAEYGNVDMVKALIKHYDIVSASIKARNGFDALHIAAKQGDLEILKVFLETLPDLAMTTDASNTTALHTAATQGHVEVVNLLLQSVSSLAGIARSNGKTLLHSAARNGHLEVVKAVLRSVEPGFGMRQDKKKQTALHMAVKGQNLEVVEELFKADPSSVNMVDTKGNTALHIATQKGRAEVVKKLLGCGETDKVAINRAGETAVDMAEKAGNSLISAILREHGVQSAKCIKPQASGRAHELKQTVSDIKQEVHDQLEHTHETRRHVHGIAKHVHKMHAEGLNNAINSTTVVAVLIAAVAFAAIFTIPGQYVDDPSNVTSGLPLGSANIARKAPFVVFVIFDSVALFISLAVVVVQTSVVVIESNAKKKMMAIINKLMWVACVMVVVAFLALSFIVVGKSGQWMAIGVTVMGTVIMAVTLGTMCYLVVRDRMKVKSRRNIRRSSFGSRTNSLSRSAMVDLGDLDCYDNRMYAI